MANRMPQEEGRYRVLLIRVGSDSEEEKDAFCSGISAKYGVNIPLLRKIVDSSPIVLKKNLTLEKAELLAHIITSLGGTVSVEKRRDVHPVSLELQGTAHPQVALETCDIRKTAWSTWNVLGRAKNITGDSLNDVWVLVQIFGDFDEFLALEEVPVLINPLPSGIIAPFKAIFQGDLEVKRISITFKDASGMPLPAEDHLKRQEWISVRTGLPLGMEGLEDSDLDVPVLEIHLPSEPKSLMEKKAEARYSLPVAEELCLEDEASPSQAYPLQASGEREDVREEEMNRLTEEFRSLSSSEALLDRGEDLVLIKESAPAEDVGALPIEPAEELPAQEILQEEITPLSVLIREKPAVEEEPSRTIEEEPPVPIEQPAAAPFDACDTPSTPPPSIEVEQEVKTDAPAGAEIPVAPEAPVVQDRPASEEISPPIFPWLEEFKIAVDAYYQDHRDRFCVWFEEEEGKGGFEGPFHRLLTILIHARFDQMSIPGKALENTKRVYTLALKPDLALDEIPPLEGTSFSPGEKWRNLFYRAIPKLREIAGQAMTGDIWNALEMEKLIQVIPHMSDKASRRAVCWIHDLMEDVVQIDLAKTLPSVGENLYRVACRLGVVNPHFDHFRGRNSLGDLKIQWFARTAFPSHPGKIEEPMDRVGMDGENGGHCLPAGPRCDGCLFEGFCERSYLNFDPSEKGMMPK